jgi:cytochrome P450
MTEVETAPVAADDDLPSFPMPRACPMAPPAQYAQLRAGAPVTRVRLPTGRVTWLVTAHALARQLLADPRLSVHRAEPGFPALTPGQNALAVQTKGWLTWMDAPEHTVHRRLVVSEFTVRRVERMRERVQQIVDGCVQQLLAGPCPGDVVESVSLPVPSLVICELLGVPYAERDRFQARTAMALRLDSTPEQRVGALREVREFLAELVVVRESEPADDLLSRLVVRYREAGLYDREQVAGLATQLLIGGHETTANMISLGVLSLLTDEQARQRLVADPAAVPGAVEELLRFYSIADFVTGRVAREPIEVAGVRIGPGEGVLMPIAAANHDPAAFADPERLDVGRDTRGHLAFGYGAHQCLGQSLARLELQIAYTTILQRIPTLALAADPDQLPFKHDATIYGLHHLPVTW